MQYFVDRVGVLGKHRRTATGGFVVDATLARVGVLEYVVDGKTVRHYNPPEVLAASLDGIATAPVTNRHPAKFVDTNTYQQVAAGHVVGSPTFVDGHLKATLAIHDAKLIADIELGVAREVSMGYSVKCSDAPGVTEDGQTYELVRDSVEWNHIAVVPEGRAGKSVRLLLDSQDIPNEEDPKMAFKIDGVEVEADKAQAAFDAVTARLEGELSVARQALAAAETKAQDAATQLAEAVSDAAIDAAVQARLDRQAAEAARVAKLAAVKKAFPELSLEGRSQDAIDALHAVAEAQAKKDPEGLNDFRGTTSAPPARTEKPAPALSARERMLDANRRFFEEVVAE